MFEPCVEPGDQRTAALGRTPWCVVTSDSPNGYVRSDTVNAAGRADLWHTARSITPVPYETCGGIGSESDPVLWQNGESGAAVPVESSSAAAALCREFDQAAVYLFVGDTRHLIDRDGRCVRIQNYRTHQVPAMPHVQSCLRRFVKDDAGPFAHWACIWGEVWDAAKIDGIQPIPVRVFYGTDPAGNPALRRGFGDADVNVQSAGMDQVSVRRQAEREAARWVDEIRHACQSLLETLNADGNGTLSAGGRAV